MDKTLWPLNDLIEQIGERYKKENISQYWEGERKAVENALNAIASQLPKHYVPKNVLGVGGSGIVLRIADDLFPKVDKALKFPRPVPGKVDLVKELLNKEIKHLVDLRHPCIVGIIHYNTVLGVTGYGDLPFYVMEFVDGAPSDEFVIFEQTDEKAFRKMVRTAAEILAYLHNCEPIGFAHLDIKPDNIMVCADGRAVAIDLGTCKKLSDDPMLTVVATTLGIGHPQLIRLLDKEPTDENRAKGQIKRAQIDPGWDLWAFGKTILLWLGIDPETGEISSNGVFNKLSAYTRKYYMLVCARLLSQDLKPWLSERVGLQDEFLRDFKIGSALDLLNVLNRLETTGGPLEQIPEISDTSCGTIQASPGNHVPCTKSLKKVIEHRLYQRLNSLSQLGLVSQVYPAAKHTRREHSLGTYANTGQFLRALYEDSYSPLFRQIVTIEDCRALLLASLLHDLGQFPLAHELEEIDYKIFNHATLTRSMFKGKWNTKKKGSKTVRFESLKDIFESWEVAEQRLENILLARPTNINSTRIDKLLRSILSGPIDADKLDYLLRDARHTDVPYPLGIDTDRLFRCLTTIVIKHLPGGANNIPLVGVHSKGRVAAEFLAITRYAMFSQVYWHHTVRSQKAMLFRAISALLSELIEEKDIEEFKSEFISMVMALPEILYKDNRQLELEKPPPLFPEEENATSKIEFGDFGSGTDLAPTDAAVLSWFRENLYKVNRPEAMLIEQILTRKLYKRLWIVSWPLEPKRWETIVDLWHKIDRKARYDASLAFEKAISDELAITSYSPVTSLGPADAEEMIAYRIAGEIPWLLIDVPITRPGSDVGLYHVLEGQRRQLRKDDRVVGELESSPVWENFAGHLGEAAGKIRIFCDPKLVDVVEASMPSERGIEILEDVLTDYVK